MLALLSVVLKQQFQHVNICVKAYWCNKVTTERTKFKQKTKERELSATLACSLCADLTHAKARHLAQLLQGIYAL